MGARAGLATDGNVARVRERARPIPGRQRQAGRVSRGVCNVARQGGRRVVFQVGRAVALPHGVGKVEQGAVGAGALHIVGGAGPGRAAVKGEHERRLGARAHDDGLGKVHSDGYRVARGVRPVRRGGEDAGHARRNAVDHDRAPVRQRALAPGRRQGAIVVVIFAAMGFSNKGSPVQRARRGVVEVVRRVPLLYGVPVVHNCDGRIERAGDVAEYRMPGRRRRADVKLNVGACQVARVVRIAVVVDGVRSRNAYVDGVAQLVSAVGRDKLD